MQKIPREIPRRQPYKFRGFNTDRRNPDEKYQQISAPECNDFGVLRELDPDR